MDKIRERFNIARKELLDLSFKNPLLNYKLRATTGLEFKSLNASDELNFSRILSKQLHCIIGFRKSETLFHKNLTIA